jgi:hypothetical protein
MDVTHSAVCSRAVLRAILYANFFLFLLFVMPVTHHWVDQGFSALRSVNLEELVGRSMQVWIVGSTIIATFLFGLVFWKNRQKAQPIRSLRFDGILLFTWWVALLAVCAYGFMLGMGG